MDLTSNFSALVNYAAKQPAAGGGNPTEAVEAALDSAIQRLSWSEEALSKIIFLWMDGPPKNTGPVINQMQCAWMTSQNGVVQSITPNMRLRGQQCTYQTTTHRLELSELQIGPSANSTI